MARKDPLEVQEMDEQRRLRNLALFLTLLGTKVDASSVRLRLENPRHPGLALSATGRVIESKDERVRLAGSEDWINLRDVETVEIEGGLRAARERAERTRREQQERAARSDEEKEERSHHG